MGYLNLAHVITIDGPGGTGKGTICHMLAKALQWHFLDSGVLYRVLALAAQRAGISWNSADKLVQLAENLPVEFISKDLTSPPRVLLAGDDVTEIIRSEACGQGASQIGAFAIVRTALVNRQRAFREPPGLVTDGRDMGTVIFPDANLKFFLQASAEERAKRRHHQLQRQGINVSLREVMQELAERDARDSSRAVAPLRPAVDAMVIDTTELNVEQVFAKVWAEVQRHFGES